jgi:2-keto-4-pentenoate hydratase/2-oxohepta-3-ene-1,7-dioic acid hydratase in catechol pathway
VQVSAAGVPEQIVLPEIGSGKTLAEPLPLERAKLLTPFPLVSKIMCVGRNYAAHAAELGNPLPAEPLIFSKPPSSLLAPGGEIVFPSISQRIDFEGELGIVIGRRCHKMKEGESGKDYILGFTIINDVTARDLQKRDVQMTRGKGFDTFCPFGPVITTELDPWAGIKIQTRLNGELRQDGTTLDMIFSIDRLMHHISQFCTLLPGDMLATGTPEGIGPMKSGDVVEISIEGIGTLRNTVVSE